jgi:transaldolase/glucose-6-phosphate isomerase
MMEASSLPAASNPGVRLGAALGELAKAGRDKVTFVTSESFASLPDWCEQLVAESTGKNGVGIVPIAGEPLASPDVYGSDRVFVYVGLASDSDAEQVGQLDALAAAGQPVIRIVVDQLSDLASEMYRFEVAIAAAGAALRIHPFNQPDVQRAKLLAQQAMESKGSEDVIAEVGAEDPAALASALAEFLSQAGAGDFVGFQAFLDPSSDTEVALQAARLMVRDRLGVATTLGFGPRFLHSTGQLHKGGANNGVFLQIVHHFTPEVAVPGADYSFGALIAAQADGDYRALSDADRRVMRICLGDDVAGGLANLQAALRG